ncbi:Alpha/beta-hydrolase [Mycena indigotica]|uniref:Carboxypeptidase n=1 Tax=Mycena indigotica TaxID=2126181 RepID=A0A8H6W8Z3_9AGAR|nr:Alpha/beta-hydrolase [Mycena indigotica]KAF7307471.1 Alpha/beta-hydrolase [Mycena indigotica]
MTRQRNGNCKAKAVYDPGTPRQRAALGTGQEVRMLLAISLVALALGPSRYANAQAPSTYPHAYPGMPKTGYGPHWQNYFEVTSPLPNITKPLGVRSFAGNVGVNRAGHPNATLFFWAFEKTHGSLTAKSTTEPWMIWLNGTVLCCGPGSSSMIGLMTENGPLRVTGNFSIVQNKFSWNKLADTIWIDQPVGTGYSTSDANGYVPDEDQMGQDFVQFLSNIVKIFPSLAKRPLYLSGESYAGTYIPYITKTIFSTPNPPVRLAKIIVGDGTLGDSATFEQVPTITTIETYPQLISYDPEVYEYFKLQQHLCGYDLNFTYPETAHFPTLNDPSFGSIFGSASLRNRQYKSLKELAVENSRLKSANNKRDLALQEERRQAWKRDLSGRANGTIDPYYGCFTYFELLDYAANFSFPWNTPLGGIDVYDIPDGLNPEVPSDPTTFMNDPRTRAALHAPTSKDWLFSFDYPFGSTPENSPIQDPSPAPMVFLTQLAANASAKGVGVVFYSGNDDSLVAHRGTEAVIQNMTFGGIQGFTRKPATPWKDDKGNFAGIVHQERNLTYVLFKGAGHLVPAYVPEAAFVFIRDFVLGDKTTGLVKSDGTVVGGEDPALAADVMPGSNVIYYGSGANATTSLSTVVPSATLASWQKFLASQTATSKAATTTKH